MSPTQSALAWYTCTAVTKAVENFATDLPAERWRDYWTGQVSRGRVG
ncbi:MAG: hypothetical protein HYR94_24555 [Chloroflexi bacterium]|nr:hypothetical protein [Chloroflexota bacterium]